MYMFILCVCVCAIIYGSLYVKIIWKKCTYIQRVHIDIYHEIYFCVWVFLLMQIFVCLCVFIRVCAFLSLCLCVFLCALQAAKNVCVEEKEEAGERCKSETASKQPAVVTASVSLPASFPLLPCLPPLLSTPALKQTHTAIVLPSY